MAELLDSVADESSDWVLCPSCRTLIYGRKLARQLSVCPDCGHHFRLSASKRIAQLLDAGCVRYLPETTGLDDPLNFVDTQPYGQRLERARNATGLRDAVLSARGTVHSYPIVVAVMDFRFLGGSMGTAVGEAITRACELALAERIPLLLVSASGGARMQEGALSLMQMAKTSAALAQLDETGVLTLSLVTDPTYGGVAASFASLCDVIVAEPGARMGFAGPRVIAQTTGQSALPADFQSAETLLRHGLLDGVYPRSELRPLLGKLLAASSGGHTAPFRDCPDPGLIVDLDERHGSDAWQVVREARDIDRPTTLDYVERLLDGFVELRGDRIGGDCPAIVGGIGRLDDQPVVLIGHQKGHKPAELVARNFGMSTPDGHRKAARLMRLAAKLRIPLITLIDTPGAHPGVDAEQRGQAVTVAECIRIMSTLPVPTIATVTGEGGSGGALALGAADRVLINAGAMYSVISPEGCAAILWKDAAEAVTAATALGLGAPQLLKHGLVDGVLPEPVGGTKADYQRAADTLRRALKGLLAELLMMHPDQLIAQRRKRFREFGGVRPVVAAVKENR